MEIEGQGGDVASRGFQGEDKGRQTRSRERRPEAHGVVSAGKRWRGQRRKTMPRFGLSLG
jgi:hypothetical protein